MKKQKYCNIWVKFELDDINYYKCFTAFSIEDRATIVNACKKLKLFYYVTPWDFTERVKKRPYYPTGLYGTL